MRKTATLCVVLFIAAMIAGCASVKPYQKSRLNDAEMQLSSKKIQVFEQNVEVYREGASGADGGKTGGGCGCN